MAKLITNSLITSVNWLKSCPGNYKEDAYQSLRDMLARDYTKPMPEPVKLGIDFEDKVYSILRKASSDTYIENLKCSENFKKVLRYCKGGLFQKKTKSFLTIENIAYCLYGKIDVFFKDKIIDIKTTKKIPQASKYLNTPQHLIYCYNEKIEKFDYLVAVLDEDKKVSTVKVVTYNVEDFKKVEEKIIDIVTNTMDFIEMDSELCNLYHNKFCLY